MGIQVEFNPDLAFLPVRLFVKLPLGLKGSSVLSE